LIARSTTRIRCAPEGTSFIQLEGTVADENVQDRPASFFTNLLRMLPGASAKKSARAAEPPSEQAIRQWLVERIAKALESSPAEIDVETPFARLGLDSRTAVGMSGELERWLGRRLSPTLIWDFPTITALARHLHSGEPAPEPADDVAEGESAAYEG
jgi:acyl carrier protein